MRLKCLLNGGAGWGGGWEQERLGMTLIPVPCPKGLGQADNGLACESPIKKVDTVWALHGLVCI